MKPPRNGESRCTTRDRGARKPGTEASTVRCTSPTREVTTRRISSRTSTSSLHRDRVKIIPVPRAADSSLAAQAEELRLQGFTIRFVSADRILADAPRPPNTTVFDAAHWMRGPRLLIVRSEAAIVITPRPSVGRIAVRSLLPGALVGSAFAHTPFRAFAAGLGATLAAFAFMIVRARRHKPTVLQFTNDVAPPAADAETTVLEGSSIPVTTQRRPGTP